MLWLHAYIYNIYIYVYYIERGGGIDREGGRKRESQPSYFHPIALTLVSCYSNLSFVLENVTTTLNTGVQKAFVGSVPKCIEHHVN